MRAAILRIKRLWFDCQGDACFSRARARTAQTLFLGRRNLESANGERDPGDIEKPSLCWGFRLRTHTHQWTAWSTARDDAFTDAGVEGRGEG